MAPALATYKPRCPRHTLLYTVFVNHLVRYGGCLAPTATCAGRYPHAPPAGCGGRGATQGDALWSWARLLKRVFALDMARCPWCQRGALRIIAAITQGEVIRKILRHLKLRPTHPPLRQRVSARKPSPGPPPDRAWGVADPSSIARARRCQPAMVWSCACDAPSPCRWMGRHGCLLSSPHPQCVSRLPVDRPPPHRSVLHVPRRLAWRRGWRVGGQATWLASGRAKRKPKYRVREEGLSYPSWGTTRDKTLFVRLSSTGVERRSAPAETKIALNFLCAERARVRY